MQSPDGLNGQSIRYNCSALGPSHRTVLSLVTPGSRVLEMGCNTGYMTRELVRMGCDVTVIENDEKALAVAREISHESHLADLNRFDPKSKWGEEFDAVIFADVLEHLIDPVDVLSRSRDVLKGNGFAVVSLPNVAYWRIRWDLLLGRFDYTEDGIMDHTHLHFYTRASIARLVREAGFTVDMWLTNHQAAPFLGPTGGSLTPMKRRIQASIERMLPEWTAYQHILRVVPA